MDTVKLGINRLRAGFILPMSLVTTVITLLLVGASATYCTTQFRTSQLYLSRTRCRLVAQSAIERTKLVLMEKCGGELTGIADPANPNFSIADTSGIIDAVMTEVRKPEFAERIPGVGPNMSVTVDVKYQDSGTCKGYNFIYATAEHKFGGRSTTVTLQEMIKVPISSGSIFDYAYFANHDGHLTSQYMVINGDVRANEDFYITGAEINGYVYASNTVHLATEKNGWGWWDNQDPCIRSFDSYNSMYRKGSKKEFNTYAKARPTNPLRRNGQEWIGGFEAVDATQEVGESMPSGLNWWQRVAWIWAHGGTGGGTTTVAAPTLTAEIKPSDAVSEKKKDYIINAQAVHDDNTSTWGRRKENAGKEINRSPGVLKMPQIAWTDAGLKQYKDYAATATTVKGKTGGSLICSNCFVTAEGKIEQLSLELQLPWNWGGENLWQNKDPEPYDEPEPTFSFGTDKPTERQLGYNDVKDDEGFDKSWLDKDQNATRGDVADRSKGIIPPGGVAVYDCITADAYEKLSDAKKGEWQRLRLNADPYNYQSNAGGRLGNIVDACSGIVQEGRNQKAVLLFDNAEFENVLETNSAFEKEVVSELKVMFQNQHWTNVVAHYGRVETKRTEIIKDGGEEGEKVVMTKWVPLAKFSTDSDDAGKYEWTGPMSREFRYYDGWARANSGDYYVKNNNVCFSVSDLDKAASAISSAYGSKDPKQITTQNVKNLLVSYGSGWSVYKKNTTAYRGYKSLGPTADKYYAFSVVKKYKTGTSDAYESYYVICKPVKSDTETGFTGWSRKFDVPRETNNVTHPYDSLYYSVLPLGYVELSGSVRTESEPTIEITYTPFALADPDVPEVTKLIATRYVELHQFQTRDPRSSSWAQLQRGSYYASRYIENGYSRDYSTGRYGSTTTLLAANDGNRSGENTLAKVVEDYQAYGLSEAEILKPFTKTGSGWTERDSGDGYYKLETSDYYVAVRLYGVFRGDAVDYSTQCEIVTASQKSKDEGSAPDLNVVEIHYLPYYGYQDRFAYGLTQITEKEDGYVGISSSGYYSSVSRYVFDTDLDTAASALAWYAGKSASDFLNDIKNQFGTVSRPDNVGTWIRPSYGYRDSTPSYLAITVKRKTGSTGYAFEYAWVSSKPSDSVRDMDTNVGKEHMIPVYEYITQQKYYGLIREMKPYWRPVGNNASSGQTGAGYFNQASDNVIMKDKFFTQKALDDVAKYWKAQEGGDASIYDQVKAIFSTDGEGYADGWRMSSAGGYASTYPVGYLQIEVVHGTKENTIVEVSYNYMSADAGDIAMPTDKGYYGRPENQGELEQHLRDTRDYQDFLAGKQSAEHAQYLQDLEKWNQDSAAARLAFEQEHAAWELRRDAKLQADTPWGYKYENGTYKPLNTSKITRELRRIFVTDGYKIDTTERLYEGTKDADLILTRYESAPRDLLKNGDTTADLLPFREDYGNCNRKAKNLGADADKGAVILIGTWDFPICIDGPVVFESDVIIRGFVTGRGTIYSGRNIHVIGDINYKNPPYWPDTGSAPETKGKDLLVLISRGSIVFGNYAKANDEDPMDDSWSGTDSLLSGNYIDGEANSGDTTSKWGKNDTAVPYVSMDYKQNDTKGWAKYKVVYNNNKTAQKFERTPVKYYESVVGDYVFISTNNLAGTAPDEASSLSTYGCSCRFAQTWDLPFGSTAPSAWQSKENFLKYGCYQSKVLDAFAKHKGWGESERIGQTTRKTMLNFWYQHWTELQNFYTTKQDDDYGGYGGDSRSQADVADIQDVNAVLYSSMGIFGIVGGKYSPVTINGAVIGQDEALFPFTQYQAKRRSWWQWWLPRTRTETSKLAMTINWDIRLNLKSTESRRNEESDEQDISAPITIDETSSGNANMPKILSWQEVPDDFNKEYRATP